MNVIFISPNFPPSYYLFPVRLREEGARVLGIGDAPWDHLRPELHDAMADYVQVPNMDHYDAMLRTVGLLTSRHGKIDRIDSNNEHWLPLEAELRRDFNVTGQRPQDTETNRSKSRMKEVFRKAGIPCGPGEPVTSAPQARAFAAQHGFPLILKPDVGVGAGGVYKIHDADQLERALPHVLQNYVIEKFLAGVLLSFDGLTDLDGDIVLCTSHVFNDGIMEVVSGLGPMHYYSLRDIPGDLEQAGRAAVQAFGIRGRFFHIEFFRLADGSLRALEVNVRPPGGFTTDMMNYGSDVDVYRLWAQATLGKLRGPAGAERKYHAAHVSRREHKRYALDHDALLGKLGRMVMTHTPMPKALSGAMGDYVYLLRHPDLAELKAAIGDVEREG